MAGKRATQRSIRDEQARSDLLDAFFAAFTLPSRLTLMRSVCAGVVTNAALAEQHQWRRDEVSRYVAALRRGGLIEAHRDGRWVRLVPSLHGVTVAKAWAGELRASDPPILETPEPREAHLQPKRVRVLRNRGRRSLLAQIRAKGAMTQAELVRACALPQPLVSRGLFTLEACGLVSVERGSGRPLYSASFEGIEKLWSWLEGREAALLRGRHVATAVILPDPSTTAAERFETGPEASTGGAAQS